MDFATILGLLLSLGAILGAFNLEGGELRSIVGLAPLLIVIGGTLGATMVTTSMSTIIQVPSYLRLAFFGKKQETIELIEQMIVLAEKARREGILGLEADMEEIHQPFFKKAVQLLIDGTEVTVLRDILQMEINYIEERHLRGIAFFQKAGGFAPTLGILGTVLGLVHALGSTSDASKMASAIAAAFIATLWGVGLANLFFLPVSDKLSMKNDDEMAYLELIMEGVVAIQSGDNPHSIRTRLQSFVAPSQRLIGV